MIHKITNAEYVPFLFTYFLSVAKISGVSAVPEEHSARSLGTKTHLPEFEAPLSALRMYPVPVKQVSASGTRCYC